MEKKFNVVDGKGDNVLGGAVEIDNVFISQYPVIQNGGKLPKDLEIGESTIAKYHVGLSKPETYQIVRIV